MQLVERHKINPNHQLWQQIDELCFLSKNLYNYCNYKIRQSFIFEGIYLSYNKLYHQVKTSSDYKALPAKVSQQVLRLLDKNWKSFFAANKVYNVNPKKFKTRPKLPKYKDKIKGRNVLTYTIQAISSRGLKLGFVKLSGTNICLPTKVNNIQQTRIVPRSGEYVVEIVYNQKENHTVINQENVAAIDLGINNLCALTSNKPGFTPVLVRTRMRPVPLLCKGQMPLASRRPLKSLNQYYNKRRASLTSLLPTNKYSSQRIQRLTRKRNNQIDNYLHLCSRWIVNHLDKQGIGKLIIGHNQNWKQSVNLGNKNNQSFTGIPHSRNY